MKLNAQQLRDVEESDVQDSMQQIKRNPIYFILENIYDTYNVGGLFRLADGLAIEKMYLCGEMEIPPNHKIHKASIGTYKVVPWEYKENTKLAIEELKAKGVQIIAIEQDARSIPYTQIDYKFPIALLLGNETYGVLPETLALCDEIAEIPMWGINKSLNVIVSAGIASYHVVNQVRSA
jgi:23S rRNA (guanosine2251-2'-O)-methyltransferase